MATYQYKTQGTCSSLIQFTLDGDKLKDVAFAGGCNGNLKGIGRLVEGRDADEVAGLVEGTLCGSKPTSCPDQLARAIKAARTVERGEATEAPGLVRVS